MHNNEYSNWDREERTTCFCQDHKEICMVNVVNKQCERCDKQPAFNMEGEHVLASAQTTRILSLASSPAVVVYRE